MRKVRLQKARPSATPTGQPKPSPIEKCSLGIFAKLRELKTYNVLHHSLEPQSPASEFEILEFYGDAVLYEKVSSYFMQTRRFMSPHLLTELRTSVVKNVNLCNIYDTLDLQQLISEPKQRPTGFKEKADVVESIIGELSEALKATSNQLITTKIQSALNQFLAFICYKGEANFFSQQQAKEKASKEPLKKRVESSPALLEEKPAPSITPAVPMTPVDTAVERETSNASKQAGTKQKAPKKQEESTQEGLNLTPTRAVEQQNECSATATELVQAMQIEDSDSQELPQPVTIAPGVDIMEMLARGPLPPPFVPRLPQHFDFSLPSSLELLRLPPAPLLEQLRPLEEIEQKILSLSHPLTKEEDDPQLPDAPCSMEPSVLEPPPREPSPCPSEGSDCESVTLSSLEEIIAQAKAEELFCFSPLKETVAPNPSPAPDPQPPAAARKYVRIAGRFYPSTMMRHQL